MQFNLEAWKCLEGIIRSSAGTLQSCPESENPRLVLAGIPVHASRLPVK